MVGPPVGPAPRPSGGRRRRDQCLARLAVSSRDTRSRPPRPERTGPYAPSVRRPAGGRTPSRRDTITIVASVIFWVLTALLILLLVRGVTETIFAFSRPWIPERVSIGTGGLLVVMELAYTVTDPPLRLLRRLIPPLRLGNLALDLGFLLLFIVILVLRQYARGA